MVLKHFILITTLNLLLFSCSNEQKNRSEKVEEKINAKYLFTLKCAACHGSNGKLGASGASDLSLTELTDEELNSVVNNGRNGMPSFKESLSKEEQLEIIKFVKSLRK